MRRFLPLLALFLGLASIALSACAFGYDSETGTASAGWATTGADLGKVAALTAEETKARQEADAALRKEYQEADAKVTAALSQMQQDLAAGRDPGPALEAFKDQLVKEQERLRASGDAEHQRQLGVLEKKLTTLQEDLDGKGRVIADLKNAPKTDNLLALGGLILGGAGAAGGTTALVKGRRRKESVTVTKTT